MLTVDFKHVYGGNNWFKHDEIKLGWPSICSK
jgi:hypothetical protein